MIYERTRPTTKSEERRRRICDYVVQRAEPVVSVAVTRTSRRSSRLMKRGQEAPGAERNQVYLSSHGMGETETTWT